MSLRDDVIEIAADVFTDISFELTGETDATLLEVAESTGQYETAYVIQGKWFFDNNKQIPSVFADAGRHSNSLMYVAEDSEDMKTAMERATHIRISDQEYVINRPDSLAPTIAFPLWQIYCDHLFI